MAEVRAQLEYKDIDTSTIAAVLSELEEGGYLDDSRYAKLFAEDRRNLDNWGPSRIKRRLGALGIDKQLIESAVASRDTDDEREAAIDLLARRFPQAPREPRDHNRALAMLERKGFGIEIAADAVRAYVRSFPPE